ncbi:MAG: peptidase M49, partial [Calditrichota bacterium]
SRKFIPSFSPDNWRNAISRMDLKSLPVPLEQLPELNPYIFSPDYKPQLVNKSPAEDGDPLLNSAVNLYNPDITYLEADTFDYQFELNGRLAKSSGQLVEEVYRAGAPDVAPGRRCENIKGMISELESALAYAPNESRPALTELIHYLQTGDHAAFYRYCELWTKDNSSPVDYILGFIEVYHDPLGRRGSYEGLIMIEDQEASAAMQALARNAAWFEARMPWAEEYKKQEFTLPSARAFQLLLGVGDGGPQCPAGINLPNDQRLRETVGTKNFLLTNVMDSGAEERTRILFEEFLPTPEQRTQALTCLREQSRAMVAMHEVIGHGSGRKDPRLEGDPALLLKEYGSTLEEARATLVALWFVGDPHLVELGVIPAEVPREGVYRGLLAGDLIGLRDYPEGSYIENDHARAGHLMVNYILAQGGAELTVINNKRYLLLTNIESAHQAVGDLLAKIQRIKATGDYPAAKDLVETYGVRFDSGLRDEVIARIKPLDLPDRKAFIMPELELVRNKMGGVTDVKIVYPRDMIKQMTNFGAWSAQ